MDRPPILTRKKWGRAGNGVLENVFSPQGWSVTNEMNEEGSEQHSIAVVLSGLHLSAQFCVSASRFRVTNLPHGWASSLNKPHGNHKWKQRLERKWMRLNSIKRLIRKGCSRDKGALCLVRLSLRANLIRRRWHHTSCWMRALRPSILSHCWAESRWSRLVSPGQMEWGQLRRQGST